MIIDSFIIEGFSNIEHIRLDIGEINALIAPNGYGKSNVLSAIGFGLMYLNANEETKGQMLRSRFLPINVSIKEKKSRKRSSTLRSLADYSVMDVQNSCSMAMNANGQRARFLAMCFRSG